MTTVTTVVRRKVRRNRQRDATIRRRVTAVATLLWSSVALHVLRVIELHVKTLVEAGGKWFERRVTAFRIGMADQTHRNRRRSELAAMTVGAGFVTGKTRRGGVVGAFVTGVAGEGSVPLACVQKLRIIDLRSLRRYRDAENQRDKTYADDADLITHLRFIGFRSAIR